MERIRRCLNCMESYEDHLESCPFCHYKNTTEWDSRLILKPGTILQHRYIAGTLRGEGETDLTYIGWDELFDRKVLIQEFFPANLAARDAEGRVVPLQGKEEELLKWSNEFVRQRENLIRLYESPDVVCVFSAFRDNGTAYMTCQYADSPTLGEYLSGNGPVRVQLARAYLDQAVRAVWEAHKIGVIHGNICPDSFWMTSGERRLVLKDFAEPAHFCGRPDLKDYGKAGTWTDVRGLALLFASMLAGTACKDEKTAAAVFGREKKVLSDMERKTLQDALQAAEGSPVSTVEAFARGILGERRTEELTLRAPNASGQPAGRTQSVRNRILAAGIGAIILMFAAIAFVTFGGNRKKEVPPEMPPAVETAAEPGTGSQEEPEHADLALKDESLRSSMPESTGETVSGNLSDGVKQTAEQTKEQTAEQTEEQTKKQTKEQNAAPAEKKKTVRRETTAETGAAPETAAPETAAPETAAPETAAVIEPVAAPETAAVIEPVAAPETAAASETSASSTAAVSPAGGYRSDDSRGPGAPPAEESRPGEMVSAGDGAAPAWSAGGPEETGEMPGE